MDFLQGEVILINKPLGWTSFDVVKKIRNTLSRYLGIPRIKVGHAGTLDPLATGLLIVCTGKYTRRIAEFQEAEKEYTGTMVLGATTPSFDLETAIDRTYDISHVSEAMILDTARSFLGESDQVPPLYSAILVDGVRAYQHARNRNEEIELTSRKITISRFELTRMQLPEIDFMVSCSKGTYIRSLVRDFGAALASGAYLSKLTRTRIGPFHLKDSMDIRDFEQKFGRPRCDNM